jgi:Arc/MetJ family transcription regulator
MKITMNIDDALLERVMKLSGARTKTAAVDYALREVERHEIRMKLLREGMDIEKRLEGSAFFPGYDVMAARVAEKEARHGADR